MARCFRFRHTQRSAVVLTAVLLTIAPSPGCTDERRVTSSGRPLNYELELLKEEESVSIESPDKQPIPPLSSEPYVMTEEDIKESGATDLPALLRRILELDVLQGTESDINRRARVDSQLNASSVLVVVDGRPIEIEPSDALSWKNISVTLPDVQRLELWKESASAAHGFPGHDVVIKIMTKTPGDVRERRVP